MTSHNMASHDMAWHHITEHHSMKEWRVSHIMQYIVINVMICDMMRRREGRGDEEYSTLLFERRDRTGAAVHIDTWECDDVPWLSHTLVSDVSCLTLTMKFCKISTVIFVSVSAEFCCKWGEGAVSDDDNETLKCERMRYWEMNNKLKIDNGA